MVAVAVAVLVKRARMNGLTNGPKTGVERKPPAAVGVDWVGVSVAVGRGCAKAPVWQAVRRRRRKRPNPQPLP
jgi:hypothetical protein